MRFRRLLLAIPLLAAAALAAPSDDEIKSFRQALEGHFNGNLPALVTYLRQIDGNQLTGPAPPGNSPSWTARARTRLLPDGTRVVIETASQVRARYRRRAELELERIASATAYDLNSADLGQALDDTLETVDPDDYAADQFDLENYDVYDPNNQ